MIAKEKLVNLAGIVSGTQEAWNIKTRRELVLALMSLDIEELKDVAGLMLIGRNDQYCKEIEDSYYDDFEEYFYDAREEAYHNDKFELANYLASKTPFARYLEDGYRNLCSDMVNKETLPELSLDEKIVLVERTSMKCRIAALKHGRFQTEPEDRKKLSRLLDTMSIEDVATITRLAVRGGRSYGEPAMLFKSKEEMCDYLCNRTDVLLSYLIEGCILNNMNWTHPTDLEEKYSRYRDILEEKLADEE